MPFGLSENDGSSNKRNESFCYIVPTWMTLLCLVPPLLYSYHCTPKKCEPERVKWTIECGREAVIVIVSCVTSQFFILQAHIRKFVDICCTLTHVPGGTGMSHTLKTTKYIEINYRVSPTSSLFI